MTGLLYDFWIALITQVFQFFINLSGFINIIVDDVFDNILDTTAPTVIDILSLWADNDLFPGVFHLAIEFYVMCFFINIAGRFLSRIWDLLPFA